MNDFRVGLPLSNPENPVFNSANGTGNLETTDFNLSITGGTGTLAYNTPYQIVKTNNTNNNCIKVF